MRFTELIDELDRPDIHINDLINLLEETISTLDLVKRIANSGLDYHEATALNRVVNRNRMRLTEVLDKVQAIDEDEVDEQD